MMKARKRFGQHFLEPAWVRKLLEAVDPRPDDFFLEIGPGRGALTLPLAQQVARVIAVEIDRDLASALVRAVPGNVQVVTADFLETDVRALLPAGAGPLRVAGNLPYNISAPILFRLLSLADDGRFLTDATVMLQREVADRLAARPGSRDYGVLGILAQLRADIVRRLLLPPGAFRPAPRVSSAVLEQMVRQMFGQRRKTLGNALKAFADARGLTAHEAAAKADIDPGRRPETLHLPELAALSEVFASAVRPDVL
jgi:16S rRNA (adenine1518-N6/adenine1519-N6)-dimethyltransferase